MEHHAMKQHSFIFQLRHVLSQKIENETFTERGKYSHALSHGIEYQIECAQKVRSPLFL
jgi:hypothetical protein